MGREATEREAAGKEGGREIKRAERESYREGGRERDKEGRERGCKITITQSHKRYVVHTLILFTHDKSKFVTTLISVNLFLNLKTQTCAVSKHPKDIVKTT